MKASEGAILASKFSWQHDNGSCLSAQVRGTESLQSFSKSLMHQYSAVSGRSDLPVSTENSLRAEVQRLQDRCAELEARLSSRA